MADPTHLETLYSRSVKKFFVDEIETNRSKYVYFDRTYQIPKDSQGDEISEWFVVHFDGRDIDTLSTGMLQVYCFSRKDDENVALNDLVDVLIDMFIDTTKPDGVVRIPYYDATWTQIGTMMGFVETRFSETQYGADGTNFKIVRIILKWGAV